MKVENLWGEHAVGGLWKKGVDEGLRSAGLSSAYFAISECRKITLMGGSQTEVMPEEKHHDVHYCFRIIRVTVKV